MRKTKICVVGSCAMDLISYVDRLPVLGETLHGKRFSMGFGGKGANQAVMAAKLSADVTMVTKLGKDIFGENTLKNFQNFGIFTNHIHFTGKAFSGVAPIAVDPLGNNSIIIVLGANNHLTTEDVFAARSDIVTSDILICQNEIPMEINIAAMRIAREAGVMTIYNPAPALNNTPKEIYPLSSIICPNESEAEILTNVSVGTIEDAEKAAKILLGWGAEIVVLTLGDKGSFLAKEGQVHHVPAFPVNAIDTTGAGDAFVGSFGFFLANREPIETAMTMANKIASISVQFHGTQTSFPEIENLPSEIQRKINGYNKKPEKENTVVETLDIAGYIDHTLLKPEADQAAIDRMCDEALSHVFASVCVNSCWVSHIAKRLKGSAVKACSVIGFPLGAMETGAKAAEAKKAVQDGATELDMVINIGELKAQNYQKVEEDIMAVRQAAPAPVILKVIIETCLLTDEEKHKACEIVKDAGADFVKTSTGFSSHGAVISDIVLMRKVVGPDFGVKASGGIKDRDTTREMIEAGANRIGTSTGVKIVTG